MDNSFDIGSVWFDAVMASVAVNDFCQEQFGRLPLVQFGEDPRNKVGERDLPYILIEPVGDKDGLEVERTQHELVVSIGVESDGVEEIEGGRGVRCAAYTILRDFERLVHEALSETDYAPATASSGTMRLGHKYFERNTLYVVRQEAAIGFYVE